MTENYPLNFADDINTIDDPVDGIKLLGKKGFTPWLGIRAADLGETQAIATTPAAREYCPSDIARRFASVETTAEWLKKGRAVFQLRGEDNQLAGYGWTGPEASRFTPSHDTTFAIRIAPKFAGRGLAVPFMKAIMGQTSSLYGGKIWVETWAGNSAAVKVYVRNGMGLIATEDSYRETFNPSASETDGLRRDVRLFMGEM